jgi:hypothetical protein
VLARALLLALAGALLLLPACGGDDEEPANTTESTPAPTATEPTETETETEVEPETETVTEVEPEPPPTESSPEDAPGGAGDEEPARSLALFTGQGGRVTPRIVRVPAFISVRVELRSADGREYGLDLGGETLELSGGLSSVSTTLAGLRPGQRVVGRATGAASNRVVIEATAEPGP